MTPVEVRKALGLTQVELAALFGLHRTVIIRAEAGERVSSAASALYVALEALLRAETGNLTLASALAPGANQEVRPGTIAVNRLRLVLDEAAASK